VVAVGVRPRPSLGSPRVRARLARRLAAPRLGLAAFASRGVLRPVSRLSAARGRVPGPAARPCGGAPSSRVGALGSRGLRGSRPVALVRCSLRLRSQT